MVAEPCVDREIAAFDIRLPGKQVKQSSPDAGGPSRSDVQVSLNATLLYFTSMLILTDNAPSNPTFLRRR